MTSALSAVFGGLTGGTTPAGGFGWYAVVLESFNIELMPQFGFVGVPTPAALTLTPKIGMSAVTTANANLGLSLTPAIGIQPPEPILAFTPVIGVTGRGTYGPEFLGLNFSLSICMAAGPPRSGQPVSNIAVMRAANR